MSLSDYAVEFAQAANIVEHLHSFDPKELADFVVGRLELSGKLSDAEKEVARAAVLVAYTSIVGGAVTAAMTT